MADALRKYRPSNGTEGEGLTPAWWYAEDGTKVYRSYHAYPLPTHRS